MGVGDHVQEASALSAAEAFAAIRRVLEPYVFRPQHEADLQDQVARVLVTHYKVNREVVSSSGRYDLQVTWSPLPHIVYEEAEDGCGGVEHIPFLARERPLSIVLELKLRCSVAAVERQAQKYALTQGVDGVMVVTTSHRLWVQLRDVAELGGKPFAAVALRSF